jgi:hypothetical protein
MMAIDSNEKKLRDFMNKKTIKSKSIEKKRVFEFYK